MNNKHKIYSINTESKDSDLSDLIEIETIILNGLYRFSILGINQKKQQDTKDRIYSALRSEKLVNLKSDNKKITVSLLPSDAEKKLSIYDLGIALSCLSYMNQINIEEDVIVVGQLSILGNIIESNLLLKSIHKAIKNNIKLIICSKNDFDNIDKYNCDILKLIKVNKINFIISNTLGELVHNIKNKNYSTFKDKLNESDESVDVDLSNTDNLFQYSNINLLKIVIALCSRKNIFIENSKNPYLKNFLNNLNYYNVKLNIENILQISDILNINDVDILEKYVYPKVSVIDSQAQKQDVLFLLKESFFGFNLIEDFMSMSDEFLYIIKNNSKSSILCFYNSCPCGNGNIFFNNNSNNKCFCIQRNIIKYRQRIEKTENDFFDFYISDASQHEESQLDKNSDKYIVLNQIINNYKSSKMEIPNNQVSDKFTQENMMKIERGYLNNIISVAKDITKLRCIIEKSESSIGQNDLELAIKLLKKDF